MRAIYGVALLALRNAIRSRLVLLLLAAMAATLIGIPLTVKGDGTLAGYVRILLDYTLGLATLLLSLATLWSGCAAFSQEIEDRQMELVRVKPVRVWQLWIGKWLGLCALNALLLVAVGLGAYGLLRVAIHRHALDPEETVALYRDVLVARHAVAPDWTPFEDVARREWLRRRETPDGGGYEQLLESIIRRYFVVPGGEARGWIFRLPHAFDRNRPATLNYRAGASSLAFSSLEGEWRFGPPDAERLFAQPVVFEPQRQEQIVLPPGSMPADGPAAAAFANRSDKLTVVFEPGDIRLMVHAGAFGPNLVRALLAVFLRLAFLAALGVTAGCMFSLPVAAFGSLTALLVMMSGGLLQSAGDIRLLTEGHHGEPTGVPRGLADALGHAYRALYALVRPFEQERPLALLSEGLVVGWRAIGEAAAIQVLLYGGILALIGILAFRRRELGLGGRS